MKHSLITIRFFLFLLVLSAVSCQHIDGGEEEISQAQLPLKVSARSSGESRISYPAHVYAFAEDGSCAATQTMTDDAQIEMQLPPARYTIVAIAGMGEEYVIPENPSLDDVITMKANNRSSRALMMGTSDVTVSDKKSMSASVTLYYAVSLVNITLEKIPADVKKVSLQMSPLYSSLSFTREYSGKDTKTEVSCVKGADGTWTVPSFYVFPGSASRTVFSVTLEDEEQAKTFGYTFEGRPEANVPLNITGSYSGEIIVEGSLVPEDWKASVNVDFDFGKNDEGTGDGGSDPSIDPDPDLSGLPGTGSIWNGGIVSGIKNANAAGADVLLMSLREWSGKTSKVSELIREEEEAGWHLPDEEEAQILHSAFSGASLDELNETIEGLHDGSPLIDIEKRYIYDKDGTLYAFGFKTTSKFLQAGTSVTYKIRLARTVHCTLAD